MSLHDELVNDPTGKGYAAWLPDSPGTVADMLNAPTESMVKVIQSTTGQAWGATGPYAGIVDAGNNTSHPLRAACLMLRETFASGVAIHLERPDMRELLDALVTTGICTAAQRDDLLARATQPASRMEVLGLPPATVHDVIGAMNGN
jgi:hypothetical protein